jgi:hypothetical protein
MASAPALATRFLVVSSSGIADGAAPVSGFLDLSGDGG